uniref:Uncharacterized protein n=1 Tax=Heterosigma akashiwo TaxID=2829 RepID=A0A7S3XX56_HETAK
MNQHHLLYKNNLSNCSFGSYTSYYGSSGGYSTSYSYGSSSGKSTWAKDRKEAGIKIMSKKERAAEEEKKKAREEEEKKKADSNCNASEKDTVSRGTGMSKDDSDTRSFRPLSSAANRASGHLSDEDDAPEMMHTDAEVAGAGGLALFEDLM